MKEGNFEKACPLLAESYRLDPAAGTLLNLASCNEKLGRTATAWALYKDLLTISRRDGYADRARFAEARITVLEPTLSQVMLSVAPDARVDGLEVKLDGKRLGAITWGTPMPIDPGAHQLEASAPGRVSWSLELNASRAGEKLTVTVPTLQSVPEAQPAPVETAPAAAPPAQPTAPPPASSPAMDTEAGQGSSTLGYVIGGVGLGAVVVGSYFGLRAYSAWDDRNTHCQDGRCDATAVDSADDTKRAATVANIAVGVGLVGVGVGTYLVLTSGSSSREADPSPREGEATLRIEPTVARSGLGMQLGGAW